MNNAILDWISAHEAHIRPLEKQLDLASWSLATTGKREFEETVAGLRTKIRKIYSDPKTFQMLSQARKNLSAYPLDIARQIDSLWMGFAQNQFDPMLIEKISKLETKAEGIYSNFRGTIDGVVADNNAIRTILREETDNSRRHKAWLASKQIGREVVETVLQMVRMRNEGARACGFKNYYSMSLELDELNEEKLFKLLDDLADQTAEPFAREKAKLDEELAKRFGVGVNALRPWHYADPFFQEAPPRGHFSIDQHFKDKDLVEITRKTFQAIGMDIDGILKNSDLFAREGKDQHAFCTVIGRSKDVRVLCNLQSNGYWMSTMLHEFGHGVYDWYLSDDLPFFLHSPAHILSTEAIAMLFGRFTHNVFWLEKQLGLSEEEARALDDASREQERLGMLILVRWILVMCHFERELYGNPDQDLNRLWWKLVRKFQQINIGEDRAEPDWASKLHLALAPVYYQNYLLGELTASQLEKHLTQNFSGRDGDFRDNPKAGEFLIQNYFELGSRYRWDELLRRSTGATLNPRHFVEQFVTRSV